MTGRRNNAVGPQLRAGQPVTGKLIPVLAALLLVAGLMTATQCLAHAFRYHPSLGACPRMAQRDTLPWQSLNFRA